MVNVPSSFNSRELTIVADQIQINFLAFSHRFPAVDKTGSQIRFINQFIIIIVVIVVVVKLGFQPFPKLVVNYLHFIDFQFMDDVAAIFIISSTFLFIITIPIVSFPIQDLSVFEFTPPTNLNFPSAIKDNYPKFFFVKSVNFTTITKPVFVTQVFTNFVPYKITGFMVVFSVILSRL